MAVPMTMRCAWSLCLLACSIAAQQRAKDSYAELGGLVEAALAEQHRSVAAAVDRADFARAVERFEHDARAAFVDRFAAFVEKHRGRPAAVAPLLWLVDHADRQARSLAVTRLLEDHVAVPVHRRVVRWTLESLSELVRPSIRELDVVGAANLPKLLRARILFERARRRVLSRVDERERAQAEFLTAAAFSAGTDFARGARGYAAALAVIQRGRSTAIVLHGEFDDARKRAIETGRPVLVRRGFHGWSRGALGLGFSAYDSRWSRVLRQATVLYRWEDDAPDSHQWAGWTVVEPRSGEVSGWWRLSRRRHGSRRRAFEWFLAEQLGQ